MLYSIICDHRQANKNLIGDHVKHKYTFATIIYILVDIMNDMAKMYDLSLKYGKPWRAREQALEVVIEDPDQSYRNLQMFMNELINKNFGSRIGVEVDADCYLDMLHGFRSMYT